MSRRPDLERPPDLLAPEPTLCTHTAPIVRHELRPGIAVSSRALRRLLRSRGGFTLDHDSGRPLDRGIAVCADPGLAWQFPFVAWNDARITDWLTARHARLAEGDVHVGGWLEPDGHVWLELVWVLPERLRPAAVTLGRLHRQHSVFDLGRGQTIVLRDDAGETRSS
jgi:hypothetical protein